MTAVVAMVFTAGAFACGSALVVLRERAESPTEVTFAEDFDRDDVGLSFVHGDAIGQEIIQVDAGEVVPAAAAQTDLMPAAAVGSSTYPLADDLAENPDDIESLAPVLAVVDEPVNAQATQPDQRATPAARLKNALAQLRIARPTFHKPAREDRAPDVKREPMLRSFFERFTRKPAATGVQTQQLDAVFAIEPGVAQRPYIEPVAEGLPAPAIAVYANGEDHDQTAAFFSAHTPPIPAPDIHDVDPLDDDDDVDALADEIPPERRAELDRAAAAALQARRDTTAAPRDPEPVVVAQRAAETVHAMAREAELDRAAAAALETRTETAPLRNPEPVAIAQPATETGRTLAPEAQHRAAEASRWAVELTGASGPIAIEKRRRLLRFYILSADRAESRAILERVMREDPDLAGEAEAALNKAA